MRAEDSQMLNILYTPIMYIHSDNLSCFHSAQDILSDVLLNHWIIKKYNLENIPDCWQPNDTISMLLFPNWHMIPKTADFIGGYLLRERLLIERSCLITNPQLLAFVSLPLRHTINIGIDNNDVNYSAYGAAFILGLSKNWPTALQQRLRLFFPQDMHFPKMHISTTPDHINLLRMAINYARDSHK